jgi:transcriptional regulator with GAF, ATPase, and Fis domain
MDNRQHGLSGLENRVSTQHSDRELRMADAFVSLADTLVRGFDIATVLVGLAETCVDLLGVTAAGLMLVDPHGRLRVMASSSERSRLVELMEIQNEEGPCLDAYRSSAAIVVRDLDVDGSRWPTFTPEALRVGFHGVYALPMRLREQTIGALNLFHQERDAVSPNALRIGQGLADVATIAILQQREMQHGNELNEQLQAALNSRIVIEQAKGVLAERERVDMDAAFELLRRNARSTSRPLSQVARLVIDGETITQSTS